MRRVTFSRNYTLSLSRTCQCYCKYCAFATHQAHIRSPEEVEGLLDEALKRNAKELLVLTGERPEINPVVAAKLAEWGHEDFTSYVVWSCERALERGMLPHTNIGVLERDDLARLREAPRPPASSRSRLRAGSWLALARLSRSRSNRWKRWLSCTGDTGTFRR